MGGTTILGMMAEWLRSLEGENSDWKVAFNDQSKDENWINVTVKYKKIVDGVETELQATFVVYWVSTHIWRVELFNGSACWDVVTEVNPIAAFYMAVGFEFVNE